MGRSHAIELAKEGADIVASDLCHDVGGIPYSMSGTRELATTVKSVKSVGADCLAIQADVTEEDQVRVMTEKAIKRFGKIDILVNNVGASAAPTFLLETDAHTWDAIVRINLKSTFLCCKHIGRAMVRRKYGRIINTSSLDGIQGGMMNAHYSAAKHGVIGLTRTLANELMPFNVTVNSIAPSVVKTPMTAALRKLTRGTGAMRVPSPLELNPIEVSKAVVWLASDDSAGITGAVLPVVRSQAFIPT